MPARPPARLRCEPLEARDVPSFGTGGFATTDIAGTGGESARAVAVQADGRIVAAGPGGVVRYNADGSLDTTFNAGGTQPGVVRIGDPLFDLAVQPDGKILVAGQTVVKNRTVALLQRVNPNGTPDTTFGANGRATTDFGRAADADNLRKIALQPDGKIVAAARVNGHQWGVARFTATGALDRTFDGDGWLTTTVVAGKNATITAVGVQPGGRIVAAGTVFMGAPTYSDMAVVGYTPAGAVDAGFGINGRVTIDFAAEHQTPGDSGDEAHELAVSPDGGIVLAGHEVNRNHGLLARLTPAGALDAGFGGDGRVVVGPYPGGYVALNFTDVAVHADGRVVAVSGVNNSAVARVNADGTLDTTFGGDGVVEFRWPGGGQRDPNYGGVAVQPDGKIVVVGGHYDSFGTYFDLARFNPDGTLDL